MRFYTKDILALSLLLIVIILFFFPLFYPEPKLIVTPDFGRIDAWHFSFATKYFYSQNLLQNKLPLWSSQAGTGFPFYAEGQTSVLFLPNLILYKLFDIVTAYNVSIVITFIILGSGLYVWLRSCGLSIVPALFGGLTLSLSGTAMVQLPHITLLQGFSLLPWVFVTTLNLVKRKSLTGAALFSFVGAQQILTGYTQAVFITYLFALPYYFWLIRKQRSLAMYIGLMIISLTGIVGLSAIQLLPSYEFLQQSTVSDGFSPSVAMYFSYPLKHILTLINPFLLGSPKLGTYPSFSAFNGSIFWENTGYMGLLPLLLTIVAIIAYLRRRSALIGFVLLIGITSFILMLGKYSPLYFLYSFWPFTLFRVPSRFIWVFVTSLIILASLGFSIIWNQYKTYFVRGLLIVLLVANTYTLFSLWQPYHALVPASQWLANPEVLSLVRDSARVYSIGDASAHNKIFLRRGWQTIEEYTFLRNALSQNSNILWDVAQYSVYAGRPLRRLGIFNSLLSNELTVSPREATVSAIAHKLLSLSSVDTILASVPLTQEDLVQTGTIGNIDQHVDVFRNPESLPRVYLASDVRSATTIEEARSLLVDESFKPGTSVLLEEAIEIPKEGTGGTVYLTEEMDTRLVIKAKDLPTSRMLVVTDTYYPGWQATIDGNPTKIYPANIWQRAVIVPAGSHEIIFLYKPKSYYLGLNISLTTLGLIIVGFAAHLFVSSRIRQIKPSLAPHRQRSHDT